MISFLAHVGIYTCIYGILALSLNLQLGFTGLMNFGQVAFLAVGAYSSSLLAIEFNSPVLVNWLAAMGTAAFLGYLISFSVVRLKATYWAIATLALGEIIRVFSLNETWLTGGALGTAGIPQPFKGLVPKDYLLVYLGIALIALFFTFISLELLVKSPFGRVLRAIREDEIVAKVYGKKSQSFKRLALVLGGGFAGLAGGVLAHYETFIDPTYFTPELTFIIWAMVIIGGRANNKGAILGALVFQLIFSGIRFLGGVIPLISSTQQANIQQILLGVLLILFLWRRPEGILKEKVGENA